MQAQRKEAEPQNKADKRRDAPAVTQDAARPALKAGEDSKSVRKLSFKDKHLLETLPGEIARLEKEIAASTAKLADANLFARDRAAFDAATSKLARDQASLDAAETLWLELEDLRASLLPRN